MSNEIDEEMENEDFDLADEIIKIQLENSINRTGLAERTKTYKEVYRSTRDHRAATRAYCAGNQWLTENAKGVGNW